MDANILCFLKMLTRAPVIEAAAVYWFVQVTGGTGRRLLTKICSWKYAKVQNSSKPGNQTLWLKWSEVVRAACEDAMGFPGRVCRCSSQWGWLWTALLLPSGASHPKSMPPLRCVLKVTAWWLQLPEPTGKLVMT